MGSVSWRWRSVQYLGTYIGAANSCTGLPRCSNYFQQVFLRRVLLLQPADDGLQLIREMMAFEVQATQSAEQVLQFCNLLWTNWVVIRPYIKIRFLLYQLLWDVVTGWLKCLALASEAQARACLQTHDEAVKGYLVIPVGESKPLSVIGAASFSWVPFGYSNWSALTILLWWAVQLGKTLDLLWPGSMVCRSHWCHVNPPTNVPPWVLLLLWSSTWFPLSCTPTPPSWLPGGKGFSLPLLSSSLFFLSLSLLPRMGSWWVLCFALIVCCARGTRVALCFLCWRLSTCNPMMYQIRVFQNLRKTNVDWNWCWQRLIVIMGWKSQSYKRSLEELALFSIVTWRLRGNVFAFPLPTQGGKNEDNEVT